MNITKWQTGKYDLAAAKKISEELKIPMLVAKLCVSRGMTSAGSIQKFIEKDISKLHDPFLMRDMGLAVSRVEEAIADGEKIAVYGDYDADGVTAVYIMLSYLKSRGADCTYHIPDRFGDGYGVAKSALDALKEKGVSLIITVDTGITAVEETEYAKSLGIDIVITDHHKCGDVLPSACAVVNPHREDCTYPFSELAGVGVAFKLICAMCGSDAVIMEKCLPYVCIGTVADVMPLLDENRTIVSRGLEIISERREIGISALLQKAGSKDENLTAGAVGFLIGPRINAAGRMGSAELALALLLADELSAPSLAEELCERNRERQVCESNIMREALDVMEKHPEYAEMSALVIDGENWHHGVLGIVASRICSRFEKPVILISSEDGACRGSGRSVAGVSLHSALGKCAGLLEKFGGHDLAAGIVIKRENISEFREALNAALEPEMKEYVPTLDIDFEAEPAEITVQSVHALSMLEPFGKENEAPRLKLCRCKVSNISAIGNDRHTRFRIEHGNDFNCVWFGKTKKDLGFEDGDYIDIVFTPEINTYGGENVQLHIKDARICEEDIAAVENAFSRLSKIKNKTEPAAPVVTYAELGSIWRAITAPGFKCRAPLTGVIRAVSKFGRGISTLKILTAFEIFSEVGLMSYEYGAFRVDININESAGKVSLDDSEIYKTYGSR